MNTLLDVHTKDLEKGMCCKKCTFEYFNSKGMAKIKGIYFYKCFNCKEESANYIVGQTRLCHACARKLGVCPICGKSHG